MKINYANLNTEKLELGDVVISKENVRNHACLIIEDPSVEYKYLFLDLDNFSIVGHFKTLKTLDIGDYLFGDELIEEIVKSNKITMNIP